MGIPIESYRQTIGTFQLKHTNSRENIKLQEIIKKWAAFKFTFCAIFYNFSTENKIEIRLFKEDKKRHIMAFRLTSSEMSRTRIVKEIPTYLQIKFLQNLKLITILFFQILGMNMT